MSGTEDTERSTTKYQEQIKLLAKNLKAANARTARLEDAIIEYVGKADRSGTMNPANLRILREAVFK